MGFSLSKRTRAVALVVAVVGVAAAGIAYASIPDGGGVFHGCALKTTGLLRVIDTDAGAACKASETPLVWNQQGQQGPTGPSGVSGWEIVTSVQSSPDEVLEEGTLTATCPTGKKVLGGGANHTSFDGTANRTVIDSWPSSNSAWSGTFSGAGSGTGFKATVYAICAVVS